MSTTTFHRALVLAALGALLAGCAVPPAADNRPANSPYRCDRNGDYEQRRAC